MEQIIYLRVYFGIPYCLINLAHDGIFVSGEFTQETQIRIRMEEDRQKQKFDSWKVCCFFKLKNGILSSKKIVKKKQTNNRISSVKTLSDFVCLAKLFKVYVIYLFL